MQNATLPVSTAARSGERQGHAVQRQQLSGEAVCNPATLKTQLCQALYDCGFKTPISTAATSTMVCRGQFLIPSKQLVQVWEQNPTLRWLAISPPSLPSAWTALDLGLLLKDPHDVH
eukprot:4616637-Amphidinium_carterae.1